MKKIDIEKWERKNPNLPKDYFEEMQKNVLENTINKSDPKRFEINWRWNSVAVIILFFFGMMFYFHKKNRLVIVQDKNDIKIDKIKREEKKNDFITQDANIKLEEILSIMNDEEISNLIESYEQDIYLELY